MFYYGHNYRNDQKLCFINPPYEWTDIIPVKRQDNKEKGIIEIFIQNIISNVLDIIPVVGNIKNALELILGKDIITGEDLDIVERGLKLVGIIPGGAVLKKIVKTKKGRKRIEKILKLKKKLETFEGEYEIEKTIMEKIEKLQEKLEKDPDEASDEDSDEYSDECSDEDSN